MDINKYRSIPETLTDYFSQKPRIVSPV